MDTVDRAREIVTVLFDRFETLDVFGPIEILGRMREHFVPGFYAHRGGRVSSVQGVTIECRPFNDVRSSAYILLIPGGIGTRGLLQDTAYIDALASLAAHAQFVLTVCTGSILYSRTGQLDGRRATTNKRAFHWAGQVSPKVVWVKKARWVKDGTIYSSSGVSAGLDMALGFVADQFGESVAVQQSNEIEYDWKRNPEWDPFADLYPEV